MLRDAQKARWKSTRANDLKNMTSLKISVRVHIEGIPGKSDFLLTLPDSSNVETLMDTLGKIEKGEPLKHIRDPGTGEMRYFLIAVNGRMIRFPEAFSKALENGDEILFISPLVGG